MSALCSKCEAVQWTQRPAAPLTSEISEKKIRLNVTSKLKSDVILTVQRR